MAKLQEDARIEWSKVFIVVYSRICYCSRHKTQQAMQSSSKYSPKTLLGKWAPTQKGSDCPLSVVRY